MSATEPRAAALSRVTRARTALSRLFSSAAERPPLGLVAEAAHLALLIEAWAEFGEASREASKGFREVSVPCVALTGQARKADEQVTRLRVELAGKQAEIERRAARLRGGQ